MASNFIKIVLVFFICNVIIFQSQAQYATKIVITDITNDVLKNKMQDNASKVLTEVNMAFFENRKPNLDKNILSSSAISSILALWETSIFRCYETEIIEKGISFKAGYEVRNIPLLFKEAPEGEKNEEAVLVFSTSGIIDDIYISIGTNRVNEILREANDVTDFRRRQIVLDFVENFRTAYNRKDASFIEKVFSEDALIITGRVVKVKKQSNDMMSNNIDKDIIEYTRQSKLEYVNKLKKVFDANKYINIKFDEIEVVQHKIYNEIYGVTLKQFWNTTNYSDVGYVFLMIDFKDEENPIIHVRTWQPEKVGTRTIAKDEVFSLGSFGKYNR